MAASPQFREAQEALPGLVTEIGLRGLIQAADRRVAELHTGFIDHSRTALQGRLSAKCQVSGAKKRMVPHR